MKAIILAAGFGTRLERDILDDSSGEYSHLVGVPKPLLPVGGKLLIDYLLKEIGRCEGIDEVYIVVNGYNHDKFKSWAEDYGFPGDNFVVDGASSNGERELGAVGDIGLVVNEKKIDDDILVVGGDVLFYPGFDLGKIVGLFYEKKGEVIPHYELGMEEDIQRRGILEVNEEGRLVNFLEKPWPEETNSRKASLPVYLYRRETLGLLRSFLEQTKTLEERDAPGKFVAWLYGQVPVYTSQISGRFDVGGLEDYKKANDFFTNLEK